MMTLKTSVSGVLLFGVGLFALPGCSSQSPGDKPATRAQMPTNIDQATGKPAAKPGDANKPEPATK